MEQEELSDKLKDEAKTIVEGGEEYVVILDWIKRNQDQFSGELLKTARRAIIVSKICRMYFWILMALIVAVVAYSGGR